MQPSKSVLKILVHYFFNLMPIDFLFHVSQNFANLLANIIHVRDWIFYKTQPPKFYNHELNIYRWRRHPELWAFSSRGVYARTLMRPGDKILDLCCGDGSYGYLFYSDIAGSIDAVDIDNSAIKAGIKRNSSKNIHYFQLDLISDPLPNSHYDWIVFNSGMSYFSKAELESLMKKIIQSNAKPFGLIGNLPKANGHMDHKFEFDSLQQLHDFLSTFFKTIQTLEVHEKNRISFQFVAYS